TLNEQPFYDKPPLFYWLIAASFRLFGTNALAARLVPALAAFLTVLATFVFARRSLGTRTAFLAALALTLMAGFIQCGRIVILDSLLTFFVAVSLFMALEAVRGERLRRGWWLASAVSCGLGVLTKVPIALVLLVPPLVAHGWLNRLQSRPSWIQWAIYVGLVGCLAVPCFAVMTAQDPRFAYH